MKTSDELSSRMPDLIAQLRVAVKGFVEPAADRLVAKYGRDPYLVLVGCVLSLRTRDAISFAASERLFSYVTKPHDMVRLSLLTIENLIYPVNFYHRKARQLVLLSDVIIQRYGGVVPSSEDALLSLPGVGRKTMNLVRGIAFGIPALCVDTHVHRIANHLGLVKTRSPEETERALQKIIPQEYWIELNTLLVMWGQNVCRPGRPCCCFEHV